MDADEKLAKHLEMIQNVVTRMGNTSFLLKGWSVTLLAAIIALSSKDSDPRFAVVGVVSSLVFWGLDAYYLRQERLFRALFDGVRKGEVKDEPYGLNTELVAGKVASWWCVACSRTMFWFHIVVFGTAFVVTALAFLKGSAPDPAEKPPQCCVVPTSTAATARP